MLGGALKVNENGGHLTLDPPLEKFLFGSNTSPSSTKIFLSSENVLEASWRGATALPRACDGSLPCFHTNHLGESMGPALSYFTANPLKKKSGCSDL
ncbi:hypothetical protein TNCV_425491 [Trichonephila clavipes]|nr:hypothetical protein TNCV_425491 [Trichonephila clavipes]